MAAEEDVIGPNGREPTEVRGVDRLTSTPDGVGYGIPVSIRQPSGLVSQAISLPTQRPSCIPVVTSPADGVSLGISGDVTFSSASSVMGSRDPNRIPAIFLPTGPFF